MIVFWPLPGEAQSPVDTVHVWPVLQSVVPVPHLHISVAAAPSVHAKIYLILYFKYIENE